MANNNSKPTINDREKQERLIRENVSLVWYVLKQMGCAGDEELWAEGLLGLWRAAQLWDDSRGVKFSTYACKSIWSHCKRWMYIEGRHAEHANKCNEEFVRQGRGSARSRSVRHETEPLEFDGPELNERDRTILQLRAAGHTLEQVGELVGLTRERVRQVQKAALAKLGIGK